MIKIAIAVALLLGAIAVGGNYIVMSERAKCDARIKAAEARFEQLQANVKQVVEEFEQSVDIEKGDREDAAKLKEILVRLSSAAKTNRCSIDGADVADAGRLLRGPPGRIPK